MIFLKIYFSYSFLCITYFEQISIKEVTRLSHLIYRGLIFEMTMENMTYIF